MRRISKYIAGAMAVCMIATNLTTPVVYAMEQTVDITSSTVTESDEVADISSGQKELDVPINSEAENSNSTEESVSSAVSVPEDTTEDNTNSAGSDSSSAIDAVESDTVNSDSNDPVDSESESQNTDQIPAMDFEEYVLLAPENGGTVEADLGDTVTFTVDGSRDDVEVSYQWQVFHNEEPVDTENAIYNYSVGEPTWYRFPLADKTEAEALESNPAATWPGVELYYAVEDALSELGEDAPAASIAWHTPNYALEGYKISAEQVDNETYVYADKDDSHIVATQNENGKWEFDDSDRTVTETWQDIEDANNKDYTFEITEDDFNSSYRCKVTIIDEEYLSKYKDYIVSIGKELTDEEASAEQVLYSTTMNVHSDVWDNMLAEKSQQNLIATYALGIDTVKLSDDGQWIEGLTNQYEYITKDTYDKINGWLKAGKITQTQYNYYWTRLLNGYKQATYANVLDDNGMPTGERRIYNGIELTDGAMEVLSEWYGKTVLFRVHGSNTITEVNIPAYTDLTKDADGNYVEAASGSKYKKAVTILNVYVPDATSMYKSFMTAVTNDGWLYDENVDHDIHIQMYIVDCESFNTDPNRYIMDAEGNYRMDSVAWGVCVSDEPDLSGKAYWALKDYIANGYGFLIGHDTLYAYAGSYYDATLGQGTLDESSIDPDDGVTWYYDLNSWLPGTTGTSSTGETSTTRGGHFYMNQLMGSNKGNVNSGTTVPSDAPSLILSTGGSHGEYSKDIQFGSTTLQIQQSENADKAQTNPKYRTPTNYPYTYAENGIFTASVTHTNQQAAFGTIWVKYYGKNLGVDKGYYEDPMSWEVDGKEGTNNFYLTGNGNFLMNQIGHIKQGIQTYTEEAHLFINSLMYISQRKQCEICAANQNNQSTSHFVFRVNNNNFKTITDALRDGGSYWYPIDGCYMLTENITLPDDWMPIKGFRGHWNNDVYKVTLAGNEYPVLYNGIVEGEDGWNLGNNRLWGPQNVFDGLMKKRTTGVARVVGDLNDLFGTDMNYAGYEVHVLGTDNPKWLGQTADYGCTVNTDSKYVISNVPCVYEGQGKGILKARVYKPDGTEVDEYGDIYVNVDQTFWNTENTTPLYLGSFSVEPVADYVTYESGQAHFWSTATSTSTVNADHWEYRESETSEWKTIPADWDVSYQVLDATSEDFDFLTMIQYELVLNKVDPAWNGYQFRAVFKNPENGNWNSYAYYWRGAKVSNTEFEGSKYKEVFTDGMTGKLTVKLWPVYAEQGANHTVSEGTSATFTASGYALDDGTAITADWQYGVYRETVDGVDQYDWTNMDTTDEFGHIQQVTETAREVEKRSDIVDQLKFVAPDNDEKLFWKNAEFHRVDTSLTVNKVDILQDGYKFRVHFHAVTVYGTTYDWYSDIADNLTGTYTTDDGSLQTFAPAAKQDYSNILNVIPPELRITTLKSANFNEGAVYPDLMTPDEYGQTLILSSVNDVVCQGPAAYRAVIYYRPSELTPTPVWQYNTYSDRTARPWNQTVANNLGYSGMTVMITNSDPVDVVYNGEAGWKAITSTMTLKNVPVTMYNSEKLLKYYFRCVGAASYTTVKEEKNLAATDKWGGLSMDYAIAIWHNGVLGYNNENIINGNTVTSSSGLIEATKDHDYSDWYYPKLKIKLPTGHHVNTAIISFDDSADTRDKILVDTTALSNAGIDVVQSTDRYLVISSKTKDTVELATWESVLQSAIGFRAYEEVDYTKEGIENGTTGGAPIKWVVDENRFSGTTYDPETGHLYKVVDLGDKAKWDSGNQKAMTIDPETGMSGYLAEINDAAENAKVQKLLNGRTAWLGGTYTNNSWKWNGSGDSIGYSNWASGATTNAQHLYMNADGTWNSGPTYTTHKNLETESEWRYSSYAGKSSPAKKWWEATNELYIDPSTTQVYCQFEVTGINTWTDGNILIGVMMTDTSDNNTFYLQNGIGTPIYQDGRYGLWNDEGYLVPPKNVKSIRAFIQNGASQVSYSGLLRLKVRTQRLVTHTEEVNPVTAAVIEYEPQSLAYATTTHSASDNTVIGTKAKTNIVVDDKEVAVVIKGDTKVYDGQRIEPSFLSVSGSEGASSDLFEITYEVADKVNHANYTARTVSATDYKNTGAVNAARYHATVSLTQEAVNAGWKLNKAQSQTECDLIINQRPINLYSYHNNKAYDHSSAGVISNITMFTADDTTGVVTGDVVTLNTNTVMGSYFDKNGKTTSHNAVTNNSGVEYTMGRNSKLSPLYIVHSDTSDPYYNYKLGSEDYTGAIIQIGVQIHSRYLENPDYPRNIKTYDSTNEATIKDIIIDGVLPDDKNTIGLKNETLSGTYATALAGETLTANGNVQSDRLKKLTEVEITATKGAELTGNNYSDYFIESESYSGAIARALLDVRTRNDNFMYGDASIENLKNEYKNALITVNKDTKFSRNSVLTVSGLLGSDTLELGNGKVTVGPVATTDTGTTPITLNANMPVGKYTVATTGVTETNFEVLKNYIIDEIDGVVEVSARPIVIKANGSNWLSTDDGIPPVSATFSMLATDGSGYTEVGTDDTTAYAEMQLVGTDTVESTIFVTDGTVPEVGSTDNVLTKDASLVDYKEFGSKNSRYSVFNNGTNIPYNSAWYKFAPAKYLNPSDAILDNQPDCDWCTKYFASTDPVQHAKLTGYNLTINQNNKDGKVLVVGSVQNPNGETVQNYTISYETGEIIVHPSVLNVQLQATVPMYVCMYGYAGDGEVVEPTNYGIKNYTQNSDLVVNKITVGKQGNGQTAGWNIVNKNRDDLLRGEMTMKLNDTQLIMGDNIPVDRENWIIPKDDTADNSGVEMDIPMTCYIAGGNVNTREESYVTKVTYTVAPVSGTAGGSGIDISNFLVGLDQTTFIEDGDEHAPNIKWIDGVTLTEGEDYEITGTRSATSAGDYTITITGKGKYTGNVNFSWNIVNYLDISDFVAGLDNSVFYEDGTAHAPKVIVKDGFTLTEGVDYELSGMKSATDDGTYTITVTGKGQYEGTLSYDWTILPKIDIGDFIDGLDQTSFITDGASHAPYIIWKDGGESLVKDVDYEISGITSGATAGKYTITITGKGKYTGSYDYTWTITDPVNINAAVTGIDPTEFTYDGKAHGPSFTWHTGYENLVEGVDYEISGDKTATDEGNYVIVITGKGAYKDSLRYSWKINPKPKIDINTVFDKIEQSEFQCDDTEHTTKIIWKDGYTMTEGVDYRIIGNMSATNAGAYSFSIMGKGDYTGQAFVKWTILPKIDISTVVVGITPEICNWDGTEKSPELTFSDETLNLVEDTDYTLSGTSVAADIADYSFTVTGKGKYNGAVSLDWKIRELIPVGGTYTVTRTGEKLVGDGKNVYFPLHVTTDDTYTDQDYTYTCQRDTFGWNMVRVNDTTKTSYGAIRDHICDKAIKTLRMTFKRCENMVEAPVIPDSVYTLEQTFQGCTSLKTYTGNTDADGDFSNYKIPDGVTDMSGTFAYCTAITKAPTIPANVKVVGRYKRGVFYGCTNLSGTLICHANPTDYAYALKGTKITAIEGSCSDETKAALMATK